MTWLEAAKLAAQSWGLEQDVEDLYWQYIKEGLPEDEAAHNACYDWDVFIPQDLLDKIK